jgi:hypothetical protein
MQPVVKTCVVPIQRQNPGILPPLPEDSTSDLEAPRPPDQSHSPLSGQQLKRDWCDESTGQPTGVLRTLSHESSSFRRRSPGDVFAYYRYCSKSILNLKSWETALEVLPRGGRASDAQARLDRWTGVRHPLRPD